MLPSENLGGPKWPGRQRGPHPEWDRSVQRRQATRHEALYVMTTASSARARAASVARSWCLRPEVWRAGTGNEGQRFGQGSMHEAKSPTPASAGAVGSV